MNLWEGKDSIPWPWYSIYFLIKNIRNVLQIPHSLFARDPNNSFLIKFCSMGNILNSHGMGNEKPNTTYLFVVLEMLFQFFSVDNKGKLLVFSWLWNIFLWNANLQNDTFLKVWEIFAVALLMNDSNFLTLHIVEKYFFFTLPLFVRIWGIKNSDTDSCGAGNHFFFTAWESNKSNIPLIFLILEIASIIFFSTPLLWFGVSLLAGLEIIMQLPKLGNYSTVWILIVPEIKQRKILYVFPQYMQKHLEKRCSLS